MIKSTLVASLITSAIFLGACSSSENGPSRNAMVNACVSGGAKATQFFGNSSGDNPNAVCNCIVDVFEQYESGADDFRFGVGEREILINHWQGQSQKSFGLTLFPSGITNHSRYSKPGFAGRCQIDFS